MSYSCHYRELDWVSCWSQTPQSLSSYFSSLGFCSFYGVLSASVFEEAQPGERKEHGRSGLSWTEEQWQRLPEIRWDHVSSYLLMLICNFHEHHDQINLQKHNPDCWGRETLNTGLLTSCYWPRATASCNIFMLERWNYCSWMHTNI